MQKRRPMTISKQIALSFAGAILLGSLLLFLPISTQPGKAITPLEALFTATSAVCVTGLTVVDTGLTFSVFGKFVLAALIQLGGLGIAVFGTIVALALGQGDNLREQNLIKESWNIGGLGELEHLLARVLLITFGTELAGALLALPVFLRDYPPLTAIGYSLFHGVSAFNNAGFDLLGHFSSLTAYRADPLMCLSTAGVVIVAGLGYLVLIELFTKRSIKKSSLQTRVVLFMTAALLLIGTVMLKITDGYTWLEAFFQSMTARTAGFNTVDLGSMSNAGLFTMVLLMVVGASPGSTGGGVKTTTIFVLLLSMKAAARNEHPEAFRRRIGQSTIAKANIVVLASVGFVIAATLALSIFEPQYSFIALLFETTSAVNTVGVTTGITPQFGLPARLLLIVCMYVGRIGPLTAAMLWANPAKKNFSYSQEDLTIG